MDVVIGVAAMAVGGQILLHHSVGMAGSAGQFRMMMPQREIRRIVVENMFIPTIYRVATITLLAIFAGVNIRRLVTADASGFLKLITLARVTPGTGNFSMHAAQVEAGGGVVELFALLPALRGMAGFAFGTQGFFMEVICFVTAHALRFSIAEFLTLFMTAGAGEGRVFAFQWKACPLVAEGIDRHCNNVGIAAQVIGMASVTRLDAGLR